MALSGLSGKALDYQLVHIEQSNVEKELDKLSDKDFNDVADTMNELVGFSTDPAVKSAAAGLGHVFDYRSQADREALGRAITDNYHNSGPTQCSGRAVLCW